MPWILKHYTDVIAEWPSYNPNAISAKLPDTSFPDRVPPGWTWSNDDGYELFWVEPLPEPAPPPAPPVRVIPVYEFRDRFTDAQLGQILAASYAGDGTCQQLLLKVQTSPTIDLDSPTVQGGLDYLVAASGGIVSHETKARVLA